MIQSRLYGIFTPGHQAPPHQAPVPVPATPISSSTAPTIGPGVITPTTTQEKSKMSFISVLETVGKDFEKGLSVAEKYVLPAAAIASLIFPQSSAVVGTAAIAVNAVSTVQNVVLEVEQKYAALKLPAGTSTAQKTADIIQIVTPTVESALAAEGLPTDAAQVNAVVNIVVAFLSQPKVAATV